MGIMNKKVCRMKHMVMPVSYTHLKEYDAIISCDTSDEVKIIVFEGDKDVKRVPIILPKSFDEEDIADLLNETSRRIEWIAKNKEVDFLLPDEEEG